MGFMKKKKEVKPVMTKDMEKKKKLEELEEKKRQLEEEMEAAQEDDEEEAEEEAEEEDQGEEEEEEEEEELPLAAQEDKIIPKKELYLKGADGKIITKDQLSLMLKQNYRRLFDLETQLKNGKITEKNDTRLSGIKQPYELLNEAELCKVSIKNIELDLKRVGVEKTEIETLRKEALDFKLYTFKLAK